MASTFKSRIPFLHFFDGFRTSHEVTKIEELTDDDLRAMIDEEQVRAHRERGLTPDHPVLRGSAQNPDTFFQAREAGNGFYAACPAHRAGRHGPLRGLTGRRYGLFDYVGHPEAERVVVLMGSGAETSHETVDWLTARGEKVGLLKVRLYRPFSVAGVRVGAAGHDRTIAVLDRTKEPGALGDPALPRRRDRAARGEGTRHWRFAPTPVVVGGRYGLSSKEFTPAMVKAVFDELGRERPRNHFTVGIVDDVTHRRSPSTPISTSSRTTSCGPSSSAWAPTARSAPTRTRSRSSARRRTTTPRGTSSTTPRSPGR